MELKDLEKKLENIKTPEIELKSHREWLKLALFNSGYFKKEKNMSPIMFWTKRLVPTGMALALILVVFLMVQPKPSITEESVEKGQASKEVAPKEVSEKAPKDTKEILKKISLTVRYEKAGEAARAKEWDWLNLTRLSDFIFQGRVLDVRTKLIEQEGGGQMVYTYSTISVEHVTKNVLVNPKVEIVSPITLVIPGGCAESLCVSVEDGPEFHKDKYVSVYLTYSAEKFNVLYVAEEPETREVCRNECSEIGVKECIVTMNTITNESSEGYRICGIYDSDPCLEWGAVVTCPEGNICQDGSCKILPPKETN